MDVGLVGLGVMGSRIAANLNSAGLLKRVHNRTHQKAQEFEKTFGVRASTLQEVVDECDVVLTMLSDDGAVRGVYGNMLPRLRNGQILADMSTIAPSTSVDLSNEVKKKGATMYDAPVVGSSAGLEKKEVVVLVGGEAGNFDKLSSVLKAVAKDVIYIGPNGTGLSLKLVHNLVLGTYIASLGEAANFGMRLGVGSDAIEKLFTSLSSVRSPNSALKIPKILKGDYTPSFSLKHMVKDLGLIEVEATRHHSSIPLSSLSLRLFKIAEQQGLGDKDYIAVAELFKQGLSQFTPSG